MRGIVTRTCHAAIVVLMVGRTIPLCAQAPRAVVVTRDAAIAFALDRSPRTRIAHADSSIAAASLALARQYENPTLAAGYSADAPKAHLALDIPFDSPRQRSPRIAAARAQFEASSLRLTYAAAAIAFETDTTYTRAQALDARARLSARTARDADSLSAIARFRREAGDASELEVELASVFAGQSRNTAVADSANAVAALVALQVLMGMNPDSVSVTLADSISIAAADAASMLGSRDPTTTVSAASAEGLPVAAARLDQRAAMELERLERARRLAAPSLILGVDGNNPGGPGGLLPVVGVAIPIPLFNRNAASILSAQASAQRASATLAQAMLEQQGALASARRDAALTRQRAERSVRLVNSAERVAAMSLLAYQEGAATLVGVLEAQRSARDAVAQFTDDIASMRVAERLLRFLLLGAVAP